MLIGLLVIGFAVALGLMTVIWILSIVRQDVSIVDIFWGAAFVVITGVYLLLTTNGWLPRKLLIMGMVSAWGLRLSTHLFQRNWNHDQEDFRYRKMRATIGESFWWRSLIIIFWLQGVVAWILSAPLLIAQLSEMPQAVTVFDLLGLLVWGIGLYFEAVGDAQLKRFKADPSNKGKLLTSGLWGLTRHPNYFGDALVWWGFWLVALSAPDGILTIYAPMLMTFLLVRVSGVVLLEKSLVKSKPGYEDYINNTPAFFPKLPFRR